MKRAIILVSVVFSLLFVLEARTRQLNNFEDILAALQTGETIRAVFHYKRCQLISDNEIQQDVPDAIGGMDLDTFEYFAPGAVRNKLGFISASKTVLIHHPRYGFVNNYAKLRIYQDGKVRIIAKYLDPKTLEIKMDESFHTVIHDGRNKGGAVFYQH